MSVGGTFYRGGSNVIGAAERKIGVDYTTQVYGKTIPLSQGKRAVYGDPIWSSAIRTTPHRYTHDGPSPDGGGTSHAEVTVFTAERDFAVSFGYNLAPEGDHGTPAILRLWFDNNLVYDARTGAAEIRSGGSPALAFRFYGGTSDQVQDAALVNDLADVATAFRNMIYIVVSGWRLDGRGTMPPDGEVPDPSIYLGQPAMVANFTLPVIRAELVDGLDISNTLTDFTMLGGSTIASIPVIGDLAHGNLYGASFVGDTVSLHRFAAAEENETFDAEITGDADGAPYTNLIGILTAPVFDPMSAFMAYQANGVANTAPLVLVDANGTIVSEFGDGSSATTPSDSLGNSSASSGQDIANITWSTAADICYLNVAGGAVPVACMGSTFGDFTPVPFNGSVFPAFLNPAKSGALSTTTETAQYGSARFSTGITFVTHLPLYEYATSHGVSTPQDGCCIVGAGQFATAVYFGMRGGRIKLHAKLQVADFGAGHVVDFCIIDPADHGIIIFETLVIGDITTAHKFKCDFQGLPTGTPGSYPGQEDWQGLFYPHINGPHGNYLTPVTGPLYERVVPSVNFDANWQNASHYSDITKGTFGYPDGSGNWVIFDTASGGTSSIPGFGAVAGGWSWDSVHNKIFFAHGSGSDVMAVYEINSTSGEVKLLSDYLLWISEKMGYDAADVEIAPSLTDVITGVLIDHAYTVETLFGDMGRLYDFSYFESDNKIKFVRAVGGAAGEVSVEFDLTIDDLAQYSEGGLSDHDTLLTTLNAPASTVGGLSVQYYDIGADYSIQTQTYTIDAETSGSVATGLQALDVPFVLTSTEAYTRLTKATVRENAAETLQEFRLPQKYMRLEPVDLVTITIAPFRYVIKLDEVTFNGDWSISLAGNNFAFDDNIPVSDVPDLGLIDDGHGYHDPSGYVGPNGEFDTGVTMGVRLTASPFGTIPFSAGVGMAVTLPQDIVVSMSAGVTMAADVTTDDGGNDVPLRTVLNRNATQSISVNTWTRIAFDDEEIDEVGAGDLVGDAHRITIPMGYAKVRFNFYVSWQNDSSGSRILSIEKNSAGTEGSGGVVGINMKQAVFQSGQQVVTKWLTVTPGDYFEFWVFETSGTITVSGSAVFGGPSYISAEFMP